MSYSWVLLMWFICTLIDNTSFKKCQPNYLEVLSPKGHSEYEITRVVCVKGPQKYE